MKIPDITIFIIIIILVLFYFSPAIAIISIIIALGILINYFIQKRAKAKEEMLFKERVRQDQEKKKQLVEEEKIRREQNLRRQFIESEKEDKNFSRKSKLSLKLLLTQFHYLKSFFQMRSITEIKNLISLIKSIRTSLKLHLSIK